MRRPAPRVADLLAVAAVALGLGPLLCGGFAQGSTLTFTESGFSAAGNPVTVSAMLTASGTTLAIELSNIGPKTRAPADVLTSFYFGIADPVGGARPTLTYLSATGTACRVRVGSGNDSFVSWTPQQLSETGTAALAPSSLVASKNGDSGWQFRRFDTVAPQLGFGIGTVGNSQIATVAGPGYAGATFDPKFVSEQGSPGQTMINLGIYSNGNGPLPGDIDPTGMIDDSVLVNTRAVFLFGSSKRLDAFGKTWIQGNVTFGFGTNPDTVLLPEPGAAPMAATAIMAGVGWLIARRKRPGPRARRMTGPIRPRVRDEPGVG